MAESPYLKSCVSELNSLIYSVANLFRYLYIITGSEADHVSLNMADSASCCQVTLVLKTSLG